MTSVTIKPIRNSSERTRRKLQRMARRIGDTRKVNREVSVWLSRWVNENFKTEGGNVGGWVPFKRGGRVRKGQVDTSAKLLQDTGRLRASFKPFSSKRTAGIGSNLPYAVYHDLGTGALPARRLLPLDSDQNVNRAILRIYEKHIERSIS